MSNGLLYKYNVLLFSNFTMKEGMYCSIELVCIFLKNIFLYTKGIGRDLTHGNLTYYGVMSGHKVDR